MQSKCSRIQSHVFCSLFSKITVNILATRFFVLCKYCIFENKISIWRWNTPNIIISWQRIFPKKEMINITWAILDQLRIYRVAHVSARISRVFDGFISNLQTITNKALTFLCFNFSKKFHSSISHVLWREHPDSNTVFCHSFTRTWLKAFVVGV